jgi:peptide-methionine (S)-S-oxide reductase
MSYATRILLTRRLRGRVPAIALVAGLALLVIAVLGGPHLRAEEARLVPPPAPAATSAAQGATPEVAVLAGGCFWGVQGVFQHLKGVTRAESGYAGGDRDTAEYERVSDGNTGHAESVRIEFDPRQVSFGQLLQIYFSVAHDPTELNRQGPDTGTQYRSEIFAQSPQQVEIAKAYIAQLDAAHAFSRPIVTRVEPNKRFYAAESYHQDFLVRNPQNPYITINDLPKVANLQRLFPDLYRPNPVLVYPAR